MNPLISVIIPVYNGDRYLSEAIESVLAQKYRPLEIFVIDDGSTDNTAQVAKDFQSHIRYIYQPNRGAPSARNVGLKMASGNAIAFLDADDIWSENKLELQTEYLAKNPLIEIVLGYHKKIYSTKFKNGQPEFENYSVPEMSLQLGTALFRKSVFDKVGLLNQEFRYSDDLDWFMRARELGVLMMVYPETALFYRRHDRNITNQVELNNQYMLKMLKKSLERRRQQNHGLAKSLPHLSVQVEADETSL